MIEKQMIRLMLNKKFYTKYKGTLSPTVFAGDISSLYETIQKAHEKYEEDIKVDSSSFLKAIWTVLLADFTMSLDNVLGVAGAAGHHYHLLVFGLVLSIVLMAVAANLISGWIKKYKWIAWVGLLAILIVAIELIYTDIKTLFF